MSTTTQHLITPQAPWISTFESHLSKLPSPEFVLTSLQPAPKGSPVPYLPRLRYCIYRGMWGSLPENKHNDAPRNAPIYTSDMPTFTTDVRMQKVGQFFASSSGLASSDHQVQGSGGGGPVEAVWWIKDTGTQWRMKGEAFVVGRDIDEGESSGVRTVKSEVGRRMRRTEGEGNQGDWSWAKELTAHFGNCSPGMRGSWKNPPPGTPTNGQEPDKDHQLGQKVEDLHDPIARENFRVVVIKPEEVEQLDISDPATARRWKYTFVVDKGQGAEGKGEWKTEELWP
ncbi:MAG: hypothetical protein ALECFALPRED_008486 [Alectoria fallacina]|uniref:Pyridoxamine 5'-phosphate oxidase Alr4036 family FMN-binding domain-containing protein n=1 Tax=Alectoria fallacina TaxID=1903189 RepID=A0A8H3J3U4_9LECA|nr:MAG: hypothetical protein ALECFALPRED_008486 [Alectoria fallacina]